MNIIIFIFFTLCFTFTPKPWMQKHIGAIEQLEYDPYDPDVAYVTSSTGVLAAISVKRGSLLWRQVLPQGETIDKMVVHGHRIVTLSAGQITRVWKTQEGDLVWEDGHFNMDYRREKEHGRADIQLVEVNDIVCVLTLTTVGEIKLRTLNSAASVWDADHTDHHHTPAQAITVDDNHEHIFTIAFPQDSRHMQVTVFRISDGSVRGSRVMELHNPVSTKNVLFKGQYLVMLGSHATPDVDIMYLDADTHHSPRQFEQPLPAGEQYSLVNMDGPTFAIQSHTRTITCIVNGENKDNLQVETIKEYKHLHDGSGDYFSLAVHSYISPDDQDLYIGSIRQNFDGAELEWYDVKHHISYKQVIPFYDHQKHGDVLRVFPQVISHGDARAIVLSEDFAITGVKNGNSVPMWIREESLATIEHAEIIDFPMDLTSDASLTMGNTFSDFPTRLKHDMLYFSETVASWVDLSSDYDVSIFGFKKLIVLLTSSGKIFGLDSMNGKIVMRKFLPILCDDCRPIRMFQMKDLPDPIFAVVAREKDSENCRLLHYNVVEGRIVKTKKFDKECEGIFRIPDKNDNDNNYLVLHNDATVSLLTNDDYASRDDYLATEMFFHKVDMGDHKIEGFGVNIGTLKTWPAWTINFGDEEIIFVSKREDSPKIADTLYRPGGVRKTMLKYLNPHMIVVITEVSGQTEDDYRNSWFSGINLYLIDTVTGEIIDHIVHANAVQPVALVQYENRITYSFWNKEKQYNVVSSLSLWSRRIVEINPTETNEFSSYTTKNPEVFQKSWVFSKSPIIKLSVSTSHYGFASKSIYASLADGQIYNIDKKFIDPRQVEGEIKAADKEEGLLPYKPQIPLISTKMVTQGNEVARIKGVSCGFADLESTAIVVAHGLDVFATLTTPGAIAFDMLNEDFDKLLLCGIVFAVGVAIVISKYLADDAKLRRAWG